MVLFSFRLMCSASSSSALVLRPAFGCQRAMLKLNVRCSSSSISASHQRSPYQEWVDKVKGKTVGLVDKYETASGLKSVHKARQEVTEVLFNFYLLSAYRP
jgi:hypothetical protein